MKKNMNLIVICIILVLALVIIPLGYINTGNLITNQTQPPKIYTKNGISFNYSADWHELNIIQKDMIVYVGDTSQNGSDGRPNVIVQIGKTAPKGVTLKEFYNTAKAGALNTPGYQQLSDETTTIDGVPAYVLVGKAVDREVEEQVKLAVLQKKGFIYMIACSTRSPAKFSDEEKNFDMVIDSFHIQ